MKVFASVALIQREDGLVLAVSRRNQPNVWGLPGGKLDPGETSFDALKREVFEETGISVTAGKPVYERQDADLGKVIYFNQIVYEGLATQQEDGIDVAWVKPKLLSTGPFGEWNTGLFNKLGIDNG